MDSLYPAAILSDSEQNKHKFICTYTPPTRGTNTPADTLVIFQINQEMRNYALRRYKAGAFMNPDSLNGCFFSFAFDTLHFSDETRPAQRFAFLAHPTTNLHVCRVENLGLGFFQHNRELEHVLGEDDPDLDPEGELFVTKFHSLKHLIVPFMTRHEVVRGCPCCQRAPATYPVQKHVDWTAELMQQLPALMDEERDRDCEEPETTTYIAYCWRQDWKLVFLHMLKFVAHMRDSDKEGVKFNAQHQLFSPSGLRKPKDEDEDDAL